MYLIYKLKTIKVIFFKRILENSIKKSQSIIFLLTFSQIN